MLKWYTLNFMSKLYTKTGDKGETSLLGGKRVSKDSLRVDSYGTVDELNSTLGVAEAFLEDRALKEIVKQIQNDLFNLGSELSLTDLKKKESFGLTTDWGKRTKELEEIIDRLDKQLKELRNFILPGGDKAASFLHLARSISRRAERKIISLSKKEKISPAILPYLNRLSDLLFVLSRYTNHLKGIKDQLWKK